MVSEEKITELVFAYMISSGPEVFIFYSKQSRDFYATLHHYPHSENDDVVISINPIPHHNEEFVRQLIKDGVMKYLQKIIDDRNDKIDSILN